MFAMLKGLWATDLSVRRRHLPEGSWLVSLRSPRQKAVAEGQIVSKASVELASIRRTTYATSAQAEIALLAYRTLYQQITLPEVRKELLAPAGVNIVLIGGVWRIVDQATARSFKATEAKGEQAPVGGLMRDWRASADSWFCGLDLAIISRSLPAPAVSLGLFRSLSKNKLAAGTSPAVNPRTFRH